MECAMLAPQKGRCQLASCGKELPKGRRKWCSEESGEVYWSNHIWSSAKAAVLEREKHRCQLCGLYSEHTGPPSYQEHFDNWMEVNHIVPLNGQGYGKSCAHHHEGLQVLCHKCHVLVTKDQRRWERMTVRQAQYVEPWPDLDAIMRRGIPLARAVEEVAT